MSRFAKLFLLVTCLALTGLDESRAASGGIVGGGGGAAGMDNGNTWSVWSDARTNYYASCPVLGVSLRSTDFSALMQTVVDSGGFHQYIHIAGNPVFSSAYFASNTITITNSVHLQGDGNPATYITAANTLNAPIFQVGTIAIATPSINRFSDIRLDGASAGAACVGIKFVNSPEPVVERCEVTGFKFAGIQINSTNANFWSHITSTWFVMNNDVNSIGLLFDREALDSNNSELIVNNCFFGVGMGRGLVVSNRFRSLSIQSSRFLWLSPFNANVQAIQLYAGDSYNICNNIFPIWRTGSSAIRFEDRTGPTNYPSVVANNTTWSTAAQATNLVYIGTNVQQVVSIGNNNIGGGTASYYAATNGLVWQFDTSGLRIGVSNNLAITNIFTVSATLDFPSTTAQTSTNLTIACPGALSGDQVTIGVPTAAAVIHGCYTGWASNDLVYVSFNNYSAAARDPASGVFKAVVTKF